MCIEQESLQILHEREKLWGKWSFLMKKFIITVAICMLITSFSTIVGATSLSGSTDHVESSEIRIINANKRANNDVRLYANIPYQTVGKKELKLHLLIPEGNKNKRKPLIVFIKGSGWGKNKPQDSLMFIPQLAEFAKKGYVVASVEHRTSHEAKFPAQLQDVRAAVLFLKENAKKYQINPKLVGVWGTSSGGHLAALLGTSCHAPKLEGKRSDSTFNSCVQAVVDWYGPTDFLQMSKGTPSYYAEAPESAESLLIGGPILENKEKVRKANPITYITKESPPFLLMHGDRDKRVPFNQSELLYEALKKNDVEATLIKVKGGGHGPGFSNPEIIEIVQAFFDKYLNPK